VTGTLQLLRLAVRRDRVLLPVWLLVFVLSAYSSAAATVGIYPDLASRRAAAEAVNATAATRGLYGPIWDTTSIGQLSLFKLNSLGAALVALLSLMLLTRHTRGEEEEGRLELLGAGVMGRYAPLSSALLLVVAADLLLALVTAASLTAAGLPSTGSLAFGTAWAIGGISFAAVAAVTAQLTNGARAANAAAGSVLGVAYLLRAITDSGGPAWVTWLSPIGWAQQLQAYGANRWWVAAVGLVFTAVAVAVAVVLVRRRDLGTGLWASRPGAARAAGSLRGAWTLALRLHRATLIGWTVVFATLPLVLANLAGSVTRFLDTDSARQMIEAIGGPGTLVDTFFAAEWSMVGAITSAFAVQAVLRLRNEESRGHAEAVLATGVPRRTWLLSHVAVAVLGSVWLLTLAGVVAGLAYARLSGDGAQLGRLTGAAVVQLPAVLVVIGLTVTAFGLRSRWAAAGWGLLVAFLLLGEFGSLLELPTWLMQLSPFKHTPLLPAAPFSWQPVLWLTVAGLALTAAGTWAWQRRDAG
jgi:ABC-2 type transport system permease protein